MGSLRHQLCRVKGAATPDSWALPWAPLVLPFLPPQRAGHCSGVSLCVLVGAALAVPSLGHACQAFPWWMPPAILGNYMTNSLILPCASLLISQTIKEPKQSHHSVSCLHDEQDLHNTPLDKKRFFSLISDFLSPKTNCISRLTHLTTHTSPLCCPALGKNYGKTGSTESGLSCSSRAATFLPSGLGLVVAEGEIFSGNRCQIIAYESGCQEAYFSTN